MKMIFRLIWILLTHSRRGSVDSMDSADTPFRLFPNDLDIFLQVNNGVYLTYADLGRSGLMLGQRFSINTRSVGWDDLQPWIAATR